MNAATTDANADVKFNYTSPMCFDDQFSCPIMNGSLYCILSPEEKIAVVRGCRYGYVYGANKVYNIVVSLGEYPRKAAEIVSTLYGSQREWVRLDIGVIVATVNALYQDERLLPMPITVAINIAEAQMLGKFKGDLEGLAAYYQGLFGIRPKPQPHKVSNFDKYRYNPARLTIVVSVVLFLFALLLQPYSVQKVEHIPMYYSSSGTYGALSKNTVVVGNWIEIHPIFAPPLAAEYNGGGSRYKGEIIYRYETTRTPDYKLQISAIVLCLAGIVVSRFWPKNIAYHRGRVVE